MDILVKARADLRTLEEEEGVLEDQVIETLQSELSTTERSSKVVELEQEIATIKLKQEEQTNLIEFYEQRLETTKALGNTEVYTLAYQSTRLIPEGMSLEVANDMLQKRSLRWSELNGKRRMTSLLVATGRGFFGILEGYDKDEVEEVFKKVIAPASSWHKEATIVYTQYISARQYPVGVLLRSIDDELLASFVDSIRERGLGAVSYAAPEALRTLRRGGDPSVIPIGGVPIGTTVQGGDEEEDTDVPPPPPPVTQKVILCMMIDRQCGAVHTATTFDDAAAVVDKVVSQFDGDVVERFGEFMTVIFPLRGTNPSTPVCTAAEEIHKQVPFSVMAVHVGPVVEVQASYCMAYGQGIRDCQRLCQLAENERRPMLITPITHDRCSKAVHLFSSFTLDGVRYFTLRLVGEKRLHPKPAAPVLKDTYDPGFMDTVPADSSNTIGAAGSGVAAGGGAAAVRVMNSFEYRAMLEAEREAEDVEKRRGHEPLVKGLLTNADMKSMFRELDVGNVGWISKAKFIDAIENSNKFPVFQHDVKKVESWLTVYNRLGKERLSFEEFAILCLKIEQQ